MQHDIDPNDIAWVFCWRTCTGELREGARDTRMNGTRVAYAPSTVSVDAGIRTLVQGSARASDCRPTGPPLERQGAISRMAAFTWGHITSASLVPAQTLRALRALRKAASAAVLAGKASEWSFAAICFEKRVCWAVHISADAAVVREIARRAEAPWTLDIREKPAGTWFKGSQIFCRDLEGRVIATLEADSLFDAAPLPFFASSWRTGGSERRPPPETAEEREWSLVYWLKDTEIMKEEVFDQWQEDNPRKTRVQFDDEWGLVTAVFGI